jgi:hypothetical protein
LEKLFKTEISPQFITRAPQPFLNTGTTDACFPREGKIPFDKLRLKMYLRKIINIPEQPLAIKLRISSGPMHFVELRQLHDH